jgi:hypothetical protein
MKANIADDELTNLVETFTRKLDNNFEFTTTFDRPTTPIWPILREWINHPESPVSVASSSDASPVSPGEDQISVFRTANHDLTRIVNFIVVIAANRAGKEKLKVQRQQKLPESLHWPSQGAQAEDFQALEKVFACGKSLKKVLVTHWEFIAPKRFVIPRDRLARSTNFAESSISCRASPLIPIFPSEPMAGIPPELELTAEPLVFSYNIEKLALLDISNCMESATGLELRDLVSRLEKAERNIKDGFAKAANAQVANVSFPVVPINGRMLLKT